MLLVLSSMRIKRRELLLFGGMLLSIGGFQSLVRAQERLDVVSLAEKVTVRLITPGSPGSGVLIRKAGNTYYLLTAAHVIKETNPGEEAYAQTYDGQRHLVDTKTMRLGGNVDLALVSFQSQKEYVVAQLGDSGSLSRLDEIYVAGFPLADLGITNPSFTIDSGKVNAIGDQENGYGITYAAVTQPGMSGGPVLDRSGLLVGIHGRAGGQNVSGVAVKSGFNLGIPINTAVSLFSLKKPSNNPIKQVKAQPKSTIATTEFSIEVVRVNGQGQIVDRQRKTAQHFKENLGKGVTLEMVSVPGGTFTMGSAASELKRQSDESPQRKVTVPSFYLGKYPVTQAQWQAIMGSNPSRFKGVNRPVETVSWNEAIEFCRKLSQKTGREYRLPSEAEWEYACRAGITTPFHFGSTITPELANYKGTYTYGSGPKGQYREQTTEVGSFPPNAYGLHDMHGNVWEWCQDTGHNNYNGAPTDGSAWIDKNDNNYRVIRGGSWSDDPRDCRSANRGWSNPGVRDDYEGFRVASVALNTLP